MAAPGFDYNEAINAAHNQGVGFTFRGFEITAKVDQGGGVFIVTVVKGSGPASTRGTWTITYRAYNGQVGKIYTIIDDQGRYWTPDRDRVTGEYLGGWV